MVENYYVIQILVCSLLLTFNKKVCNDPFYLRSLTFNVKNIPDNDLVNYWSTKLILNKSELFCIERRNWKKLRCAYDHT